MSRLVTLVRWENLNSHWQSLPCRHNSECSWLASASHNTFLNLALHTIPLLRRHSTPAPRTPDAQPCFDCGSYRLRGPVDMDRSRHSFEITLSVGFPNPNLKLFHGKPGLLRCLPKCSERFVSIPPMPLAFGRVKMTRRSCRIQRP